MLWIKFVCENKTFFWVCYYAVIFKFAKNHSDFGMLALLNKELYQFFRSITGYVVLGIFLIILSLFLWLFPTQFNIINSGLADFEPMFLLMPWLFLFLVPAITMRSIAEEKKQGTLEFLMTKPLGSFNIVLAKYLAALVIILIAMVSTLVYFVLVQYFLSQHLVDTGAFWGSFVGTFLLASSFAAIGIFSSSITSNQIIAFLIAVLLSLVMYIGFSLLSQLSFLTSISQIISYLGIDYHFQSISKGVIDSRDIIYFLSLIAIFLYATVLVLNNKR